MANRGIEQRRGTLKLLPWGVRYALKCREGMVQREEIDSMIRAGFTHESVYLVSKALAVNLNDQIPFIENVTDACLEKKVDTPEFRTLLLDTCAGIDPDHKVNAVKLAQWSRQDFDLWQRLYSELARDLRGERIVPVMLGNAVYHGLKEVIGAYRESSIPLYLLAPERLEGEDNVGLTINLDEPFGKRVRILQRDFVRPGNAILVDGTKNHGTNLERARKFWGTPIGERIIDTVV